MRIEQFKAIEGTASDVRQTRRATIISNGGIGRAWDKSWDASYECLFRLSEAPVTLRVGCPIFIEDGETVRVVGSHNGNGVFDAVAYYNRSSGASGMPEWVWSRQDHYMIQAVEGALLVFFVVFFVVMTGALEALFVNIGVGLFGGIGLVLMLYSLRRFVRSRSEIRAIERLLKGE
jgi:hypothetical protein